jgi:hypothetical protein
MKRAKSAVESALSDKQRAALIRATKNECAGGRLFVDFWFVDNCVQNDSIWRDLFVSRVRCSVPVAWRPGVLNSRSFFPGAAQHEMMRCRPGIVSDAEFVTIPNQRRSVSTLHRVRDTNTNNMTSLTI